MNAILRFSMLMRCAPLVPRGRGFMDFKLVDEVAEEIVSSALQMAWGEGSGGIQFTHNSSGTKVPIDGFCEHLEKVYGGYFEAVEMREWIRLAVEGGH